MAPRGSSWRKPLTLIYDRNYKYGNSLYADQINNIERKYYDSIARTHLRSDRFDVGLSTFSGSGLTSGPLGISTDTARSHSPGLELDRSRSAATATAWDDDFGHDLRRARSFADLGFIRHKLSGRSSPVQVYSTLPRSPLTDGPMTDDEGILMDRRARRRRRHGQDWVSETDARRSMVEDVFERFDFAFWTDKCRELQLQIENLTLRIGDAESKVKSEVTGMSKKMKQEMTQLEMSLSDSNKQNSDLNRVIKKQAQQLSELQSLYDEVQRHLQEAVEQLNNSQRRCQTLQQELNDVRTNVEQASISKSSSRYF